MFTVGLTQRSGRQDKLIDAGVQFGEMFEKVLQDPNYVNGRF